MARRASAPISGQLGLLLGAFSVLGGGIGFAQQGQLLTGQAAFTDWNQQQPGVRHKITVGDLPAPNPSEAVNNTPHLIERPSDAWPTAPAGFKVTLYAGGDAPPMQRSENREHMRTSGGTFTMPRLMRTAPNGDVFLADSGAGTIFVLRGVGADGKAATIEKFATDLDHPFGIALFSLPTTPGGCTSATRRPCNGSRTRRETSTRQAPPRRSFPISQVMPSSPGEAIGRAMSSLLPMASTCWCRSVRDPTWMTRTHTRTSFHRADVLEFAPDGKFEKVYAYGIRNCVGEAINPVTHQLWCSTNERDDLGNHLVPDYVTSVPEGSFFGWPWYYMGGHRDPRRQDPCATGTGPNPQIAKPLDPDQAASCKRIDLSAKVRTPDVLMQPHMASLELTLLPDADCAVPLTVHRRHLRGGARIVEPRPQGRIQRRLYSAGKRQSHR